MYSVRKLSLCVLALMLLLLAATAATAAPGPAQPFSDLAPDSKNVVYINYVVNNGLMSGFPDGTFRPDEGLTRAEAASVVARAAKLTGAAGTARFRDVPANHWAAASIAAASAAGILHGNPDGTFRPDAVLTRAEAVAMILGMSKQEDPDIDLPAPADVGSTHWAARPVAIALASGMVETVSGRGDFLPDGSFTRRDLARALGVLLTKDPLLYQTALPVNLNVVKGEVVIAGTGGRFTYKNEETAGLKSGDTIVTGPGAAAEIVFPDGSGLRLEENTEIVIKEAKGRSSIMADGTQGTVLDWLELDLKKGKMFGALATRYDNEKTDDKTVFRYPLVASRDVTAVMNIVAATTGQNPKSLPWWQVAETKKVRVKVDMPWGVAAIRGTFWKNSVDADGKSTTSLLVGEADVTAGGSTVSLTGGQRTEITSSGASPADASPMTEADNREWAQAKDWVQQRASGIEQALGETADNGQPAPATETVEAINEAIGETVNRSQDSSPAPSSSGSDGGGGGGGNDDGNGSSTDKTPPGVEGTYPANGSADAPPEAVITITFKEKIYEGSSFSAIKVMDGSNGVVNVKSSISGDKLLLEPENELVSGVAYYVDIPAGAVKDKKGNEPAEAYDFSFTVNQIVQALVINDTTPDDGAQDVDTGITIVVKFDRDVQKGSCFSDILLQSGEEVVEDVSTRLSGKTLTINPDGELSGNTSYTVFIPAGAVEDEYGNQLAGDYSFVFKTVSEDEEPPEVTGTEPEAGADDVQQAASIKVTFSESIVSGDTFDNISLKDAGGAVVDAVITIDGDSIVINPVSDLLPEADYSVFIPAGAVEDDAGNKLAEDFSFTFKTVKSVPASVSGRVIDADDGQALEGVTVELYQAASDEPVSSTVSGSNGEFLFADLVPGPYTLKAHPEGYLEFPLAVTVVSAQDLTDQNLFPTHETKTGEVRIVLTWGETPDDLDAHLQWGESFHVYFAKPNEGEVNLDVDCTESFGPETITITQVNDSDYSMWVDDYTNQDDPESMELGNSGAEVRVYLGDSTEPVIFNVPQGAGNKWTVFDYNGSTGVITAINELEGQVTQMSGVKQ